MNQNCARISILFVVFTAISSSNSTIEITGEFQVTTTACGASRGVIKHIGFNDNENFLTLYDICYNNNNGEALYSTHAIIGSSIPYTKSDNISYFFNGGGLASGVNTDNYKQTEQLKVLTNLLGSATLAKHYINSGSYLEAGLLVPYADHVHATYASVTYFYINTVPQWQQIINGNWKSLEFAVRSVASNTGEDLQVVTGGWGVLQLEDVNGKLVDMYLSGNKLPVPKFVWKVAYSTQTKRGIAFAIVNNPFLNEVTEDNICTNICDTNNWGTADWSNAAKGLLYCCDVDELRNNINTIPNFDIIDTMKGFSAGNMLRKLFDM